MQAVMKFNDLEPPVHQYFYRLPERLQEANASVVAASFQNQNHRHLAHLLRDLASVPDCLDQFDKYMPSFPHALCPLVLFLYNISEPLFHVLCFDTQHAASSAIPHPFDHCSHLGIGWCIVVDLERVHIDWDGLSWDLDR